MDTEVIKITEENLAEAAQKAADILLAGGLVGLPTETVYGLAANAFDDEAVKKIYSAKGRPSDNPIIVHISDYIMLNKIASTIDDRVPALAKKFWPGPLTIVLPKTGNIGPVVSGGLSTVAIRMPSHPVARAVIEAANVPLAAPSANVSGYPSTTTAAHVKKDLDGRIPLILDAGPCEVGVESTVITLAEDVPQLLRPGIISAEELREILPDLTVSPSVFAELPKDSKVQSPGMKYKHYSPRADVIVVKGSLESFSKYVLGKRKEGCYAMCFDGEEERIPIPSVPYGGGGDAHSQARHLFSVLRTLDDVGARSIFVRAPLSTGESMAVFNRLIRAAGFKVVEV